MFSPIALILQIQISVYVIKKLNRLVTMNIDKDYIIHLKTLKRKKRNKYRLFLYLPIVLALFTIPCMLFIANNPLKFNFPTTASSYLLNTVFFKFSSNELKTILIDATGTAQRFVILNLVYWLYFFAILLVFVLTQFALINTVRTVGRNLKFSGDTLLQIQKLQNQLKIYILQPSSITKLLLTVKIFYLKPCARISPLRLNWYKRDIHHWFNSKLFDKNTRVLVHDLNRFDLVLVNSLKNPTYLSQLLKAIECLELFYYSVLLRTDNYFEKFPLSKQSDLKGIDILHNFSKHTKYYLSKSERLKLGWKQKLINYIINIIRQPAFRQGLTIGIASALVMVVGVLIFNIESKQAFITWFTVAFGSMTISIGISTINIKRQSKYHH